ncbi:MAG: hypothetical protein J7L47_09200 [Candidatus Odinarchaeota archaeon]|nr:hypothetical protein [Candidatus Odinarchaeota archaeon]
MAKKRGHFKTIKLKESTYSMLWAIKEISNQSFDEIIYDLIQTFNTFNTIKTSINSLASALLEKISNIEKKVNIIAKHLQITFETPIDKKYIPKNFADNVRVHYGGCSVCGYRLYKVTSALHSKNYIHHARVKCLNCGHFTIVKLDPIYKVTDEKILDELKARKINLKEWQGYR